MKQRKQTLHHRTAALKKLMTISEERAQLINQLPEMLTVPEVCKLLRLSKITVLRRLNDSAIPRIKIGSLWRCSRKQIQMILDGETDGSLPG